MDEREQLYLAWAPPASPWAAWAKPVLFAHRDSGSVGAGPAVPRVDLSAVPAGDGSTAVVVDLPGPAGVAAGVALAGRGYRPVPLYNAVPGPSAAAAVDVGPILAALVQMAGEVVAVGLAADAPPAFLLDADRRVGRPGVVVGPGVFDNRSVSLPTDFPSAGRLWAAGVRRAVLVQPTAEPPQADLAHTLRRWQEGGLRVLRISTDQLERPPVPITVTRPGRFRSMWHGMMAVAGLRRSPLGGFGGTLPVPSAG